MRQRPPKEGQAVALLAGGAGGPAGVLRGGDEALGVWHEAEDAAGLVAQAGDVAREAFRWVATYERAFWQMAYTGKDG